MRTKSQWEGLMDRKEEENTEMLAALGDIRTRIHAFEEKLDIEM